MNILTSRYIKRTVLVFHENLIDTCNVLSMTIPTYTNITVYIILFTDIRLCEFDVIRSSQISEDTCMETIHQSTLMLISFPEYDLMF